MRKIIADILGGWISELSTPEAREAFAESVIQALKEVGYLNDSQ